ncbi:MAG: type IV pilus modification protein PilV [Gammaproteobacteria bacterium]|nr:type IV pilus modification protein PilV [Gammaproteobacteria bacterium]
MNSKTFYGQRGTSLLEVLIATVVIASGLLGIAALQLKSIQNSTNAQYRAIATDIAWTMADRMRANLAEDNSYSNVTANCAAIVKSCTMVPTATNTASTDSCSAAEIAAYDIKSVLCTVSGQPELPGGTLSIAACDDALAGDGDVCSPHSTFEIKASWRTRTDFDGSGEFEDEVILVVVPGAEGGI